MVIALNVKTNVKAGGWLQDVWKQVQQTGNQIGRESARIRKRIFKR
ncbi:MAG: hypothetical protein HY331_17990 [Chloroflexi bacterium]|nr:hypothetical protein [Chloroflexota bacterium]